jgi:DNA polymerase V
MSNRGGKRENAGRPRGQGKFGEPTVAMRIPESKKAAIRDFLDAYQRKKTDSGQESCLMDECFTPDISARRIELPLFSSKVAAGFPSPADDYVEKRLDINEFLIDHAASTFFVTIVLAVVDREFTIKILDRTEHGRPRLLPANSSGAYVPIEISDDMQFEIFGVVTGSFRRFE